MSFLLILFSFLFLFRTPISTALEREPLLNFCDLGGTYTNGSKFEVNLRSLLSSLVSNATPHLNSFYNTSYGNPPDRVYALAQCMSNASLDNCTNCLNVSAVEILRRCPNQKDSAIRYYDCFLRYSDIQFFSQRMTGSRIKWSNNKSASYPDQFDPKLAALMNGVAAAAASSPLKYATDSIDVGNSMKIYGMGQCTRDLSQYQCGLCLRESVSEIQVCCDGKTGGNVYYVSCNLRYETFPFFVSGGHTEAEDFHKPGKKKPWETAAAIAIPLVLISSLFFAITYCFIMRKKKAFKAGSFSSAGGGYSALNESLLFDLRTIKAATNDFSNTNKLGEGGFGPVYKAELPDGKEIAVKRLSTNSGQGMEEFENEVSLVAKLQHRNLVRILGCCAGDEKLLIYEYVSNRSLDIHLFDPMKARNLDWQTRFKIIRGIARGILYLHEESIFRIIHRDIKASNILLDEDMNPKISDFGMARLLGVDQTQGSTGNAVGTYGYMAPEFAMRGRFSIKSDVFSFGVLLLEIVSGKKNSSFHHSDSQNLLQYTWRHWQEGTTLKLMDSSLGDKCPRSVVLRMIHVGLLCVQEDPSDRPAMSAVVLMLSSNTTTLYTPKPPAFTWEKSPNSADALGSERNTNKNKLSPSFSFTITEFEPR